MNSQMAVVQPTATRTGLLRRLGWVVPLAVLAATAADLGLYYAAGILFPEVTDWAGAGPMQIAGANVAYLVAGALALVVVARVSRHPARHFVVLTAIGLVLSFALPISAGLGEGSATAPAASTATVVTLSLMHVVSYAVAVPMLVRLALTGKG